MYNFEKAVCTLVLCVHHVVASLLVSVFLALLVQIHIWKQVNHLVSLIPYVAYLREKNRTS